MTRKPIEEWIIAVGQHEGFIPSEEWIETQELLAKIAEKYNRPHRRTNALLAGIIFCPICGKRLSVTSESNRWTHGKPRFKYTCPGVRKKDCTFKAVDGVLLDEFVVAQLSNLSDESAVYYNAIFNEKLQALISNDETETEYRETKKAIERTKAAIAAQVRNMREAGDSVRRFIEADITEMSKELEKLEKDLARMEESKADNTLMLQELNEVRKKLLSFAEYAKGAQPEELVNLISTVVERIYITTENDKRVCHIFVKGCTTEDYTDLFGAADYIQDSSNPLIFNLCDSEQCRENDMCDIKKVFREHDAMILREQHISCFQVNWLPKSKSIVKISDMLGIGLDSMVFIDDSMHEIEEVRSALPEVRTILFQRDTVYEQLSCLNLKSSIDIKVVKQRTQSYQTMEKRMELQSAFSDDAEYLSALENKIDIHAARFIELGRISELTQRTNRCSIGLRYTKVDYY